MYISPNIKEIKVDNSIPEYGFIYKGGPDQGEMTVNLKRGDVLNTIIHEQLHVDSPRMAHRSVYKRAYEIEGKMSLREMGETLVHAHDRMLNPIRKREMVHTTVSKVISSVIK